MNAVFRLAQLSVVTGGVWLVLQGFPVIGLSLALMACWYSIFDVLLNRVVPANARPIEEKTACFHDGCFIADLHADICLWRRNLMRRHSRGHVDRLRLREGNVALQQAVEEIKQEVRRCKDAKLYKINQNEMKEVFVHAP